MSKVVLFQGDSVTDVDRFLESTDFLGNGYVHMVADKFRESGEDATVINRGISGNRTIDLVGRWQQDCIDLAPDVVTILIGINDCWRKYDSNDETALEDFKSRYDRIVKQTVEQTKAQIILMDPFVLPYPEDRKAWRVTLDPEILAVRELAMKYHTHYIPLDAIFAKEALRCGYQALSEDGVHPTKLGHELICKVWYEEYQKL